MEIAEDGFDPEISLFIHVMRVSLAMQHLLPIRQLRVNHSAVGLESHCNRSMADAICLALYSSLEHLNNEDTYVRLLPIDYNSAFSTVIPNKLISKLQDQSLRFALCQISNNNETEYRKEIECLVAWYKVNNLSINVNKTKELVINFRKQSGGHVCINVAEVEMVKSVKFLGAMITNNLSWSTHIDTMIKKAQQRLYFFRMRTSSVG
eukprot:g40560.t1